MVINQMIYGPLVYVSVGPRVTETGAFPPIRLAPDRAAYYALASVLNVSPNLDGDECITPRIR